MDINRDMSASVRPESGSTDGESNSSSSATVPTPAGLRHILPISFVKSASVCYSCKDCTNKFLTLLELKRHELTHSSKKQQGISCKICSMGFNNSTGLSNHMKTHSEFVCRSFNCKQMFETIELRQEHERLQHSVIEVNHDSPQKQKAVKRKLTYDLDRDKDFELETNDIEMRGTNPNFVVLNNIPTSSSLNNFPVNPISLIPDPEAIDPLATYQCSECKAEFLEKEDLTRHVCYSPVRIKSENEEEEEELNPTSFQTVEVTPRKSKKVTAKTKPTNKKMPTCETCSRKFTTATHLATHIRWKHNSGGTETVSTLTIESKKKNPKRVRVNNEEHSNHEGLEIPGPSSEMSEMIETASKYKELSRLRPRREQGPFLCTGCGENFDDKEDLQKHNCNSEAEEETESDDEWKKEKKKGGSRRHNSDSEADAESEDEWKRKKKKKKNNDCIKYSCHFCGSICRTKSIKGHHERKAHPEEYMKWKSSSNRNTLGSNNLFKCKECEAGFRTEEGLVIHERYHTGEAPFKCSQCERCFRGKKLLRRHVYKYHPAPETLKFPCTQCDKKFRTNTELESHAMSHSSLKPFQCHKCGGTYKSKSTLKQHIIYKHRYDEDVQKEYWNKGGDTETS